MVSAAKCRSLLEIDHFQRCSFPAPSKSGVSMNPPLAVAGAVELTVPADLPPVELSQNARTVLAKRYLRKDDSGNPIEEPQEMFWRVATVIAQQDARYGATPEEVESLAREFYAL